MSTRKTSRPRKRGRPRKEPGAPVDHRYAKDARCHPGARFEENKSRADAAKLAELTDDAIRKAMKDHTVAREFYSTRPLKAALSGEARC
jgi:hypothetical protein